MKAVKMTLCILVLGISMHSFAQNGLDAASIDTAKVFGNSSTVKANANPLGSGAVASATSNVAVSSTLTGGADGKITATYHFKHQWSGSIMVDQTLGKSDSSASFYDFSKGITPGTTVTFNIQKFLWSPKENLTNDQFDQIFDSSARKYAREHNITDYRSVSYNDLMTDIMTHGTVAEKAEAAKLVLKNPVFFNLQVAFTKSSFNYTTDSVKLKKSTAAYLLPAIKAYIGFVLGTQGFLSFSYLYSDTYQASTSMSFESPFGTSKNMVSQTLNFGAPKETRDSRVGVELRRNFGQSEPDFAIDPTITYGINSQMISFEMPLYFIKGVTSKGKPNGLQGGVDLGYISSTKEFVPFTTGFGAQLVLSAPFSIFQDLLK